MRGNPTQPEAAEAARPGSLPRLDKDLMQSGWRASLRSVNGLRLHVVEAGTAGAPLLILLHGFPEFWWAWRKQITGFAAAGWHVVVPDLRGYNHSDAPQGVSAYGLDTLADDVAALADHIGAPTFCIVGHDWGAVIAWWVATRHGARVQRAVMINGPHPDVLMKQALTHPTQALRSAYVAFFQWPWLPEAALRAFGFAGLKAAMSGSARPGAFEPGAMARYAQAWSREGRLQAMLNYYRALRERSAFARPARVLPTTLVLWADQDRFLEQHVAEASLALCDDGRLQIIEGASHWMHLEQPERINAEILRFLEPAAARMSPPSARAGTQQR